MTLSSSTMEFTQEGNAYIKSLLNPIRFKIGMFKRLPSIFFWGAKVKSINNQKCEITVPYKWATKNPFSSVYFAAQCGVGEISTGLMLDALLRGRGRWSMLVIDFNAKFTKKAISDLTYTCHDGQKFIDAIEAAEQTGKPQVIESTTIGTMSDGVIVGEMKITWSILKKS